MPLLIGILLFIIVMVGSAYVGLRLYVKPTEAIERVKGIDLHPADTPKHPSLLLRDFLLQMGTLIPNSPKDVSVMQRKLIRAGIKSNNALTILYGSKVVLAVAFPVLASMLVFNAQSDSTNKIAFILAAAAAGFWGPNEFVKLKASKRQKEIARGLANALDLMVVSVESGLGLDQAILQVAKELHHAHPEISEEFALVNLELKAGKRRAEALRNLGERTNADDLKKLVAVLIQADRFGTGIAQSLRAHADYMRVQARQIAEEKAAKLGVKLVFPIFFCILPSLFVVTVGPMVIKITRELLPMMNGV
jgi:tight adherence protein C